MKIPIARIFLYRKKERGPGYYPVEEIYYFENLKINLASGSKKSTFSLDIINHKELSNGVYSYIQQEDFKKQDYLKIYAYYNDDYTGNIEDHFLFNGFIDKVTYTSNSDTSKFSISGSNATDMLLNSIVPALYTEEDSQNVSDMVIDLTDKAKSSGIEDLKSVNVELATGTMINGIWTRTGGGYIWPNKSNGESFPNKAYVQNYISLFAHYKKLSSSEYTEDPAGNYYVYVDEFDNLHFEPKKLVVEENNTLNEYTNNSEVKKSFTSNGLINVVVLNCGPDPSKNGVLVLGYNINSVRKNGPQWKYYTEDKTSSQIMKNEIEKKHLSNSGDIGENNFPDSYPWYIAQSGTFMSDVYNRGDTVSNDKEYKDYIRTITKSQGSKRANAIVNVLGDLRPKINWESDTGTLDFEPNALWNITLNSIDFRKKLRVVEVNHSFSNEWKTSVVFEEDEKSIPIE